MDKTFELMGSIERLQDVASREGTVHDDEAEPLMEDVECILSSVADHSNNSVASSSKWESEVFNMDREISSREMKRLRGLMCSSKSIHLNTGCKLGPCSFMDRSRSGAKKWAVRQGEPLPYYSDMVNIEL